jgi:hypothetical protein
MGLRDLLGVRKAPEGANASKPSASSANVLQEEAPIADSEPLTSSFATPASMAGDLKGMGGGGGGRGGGGHNQPYNPYTGGGGAQLSNPVAP